jgi:tuftelin-interacting protein 11
MLQNLPNHQIMSDSDSSVKVNFAQFEKNTKGIGSKLLEKWGFKVGQGLGADGSGITEPITAKLRPSNMGIGLGGFTEKVATVAEPAEEDTVDKLHGWKRKKRRIIYKTAKQLIDEQNALPTVTTASVSTNIIDMTGKSDRKPFMGSLSHLLENITLIADISQSQLLQVTRTIRIDQENLQTELKNIALLQDFVNEEKIKVERQKTVIGLLHTCVQIKAGIEYPKQISVAFINNHYGLYLDQLKQNYMDEYINLSLDEFVVSLIAPMFQSHMKTWDPLNDTDSGIDLVKQYRSLLIIESRQKDTMTAYEALMYQHWLPKIRRAVK